MLAKRFEIVAGISAVLLGTLIPVDLAIRNRLAEYVWFSSEYWPMFFLLTPSNIIVGTAAIAHYKTHTRLRLGALILGILILTAFLNNALIVLYSYWLLYTFAVLKQPLLGTTILLLDFGLMVAVIATAIVVQAAPVNKSLDRSGGKRLSRQA
jgi:hypothetical protein